jgi:hypothetical protein
VDAGREAFEHFKDHCQRRVDDPDARFGAERRGFKDHGEYEVVKGFEAQKLGHTITAIFDPSADTETGFLSCFAEPQEAAEFLTFKSGVP